MRELLIKIQNLLRLARVDRPGVAPQLAHYGDGVIAAVRVLQPQGVHFVAPAGAVGAMLSPGGVTAEAVALNLSGSVPSGAPAAGEGGLHYLGAWKLYLAADGTVHLGDKDPGDFVALASKVDDELARIKDDLTALKSAISAGLLAGGGAGPSYAGGAAQKTAFETPLATPPVPSDPSPVGSEKVKAE